MKKLVATLAVCKVICALAVCFTLTFGANAQSQKIATIDMVKVFNEYYKTAQVNKQISELSEKYNAEWIQFETDLKAIKEEYLEVIKRLQDPAATEEAKAKDTELAKQLNEKGKKQETDMAQFKANGLRTLDSEKSRLRAKIISEISEVVSKRAQSDGYTLVLNTAYNEDDPKRPIIFTSGKNDITQEVLDILNADADKKTE